MLTFFITNFPVQLFRKFGSQVASASECFACRFAVGLVQNYVKSGATEDDIGALVRRICLLFRIEKPNVCDGVVKLFKVNFKHIEIFVLFITSNF